jgi:hypothetical protein
LNIIESEMDVPMDLKTQTELQRKVLDLQDEVNSILRQLTTGTMKKKIKICEEETETEVIGWHDGKELYRKPKISKMQEPLPPIILTEQSKTNHHTEPIIPPDPVEVAEGPVFSPDADGTFEAESLI